MIDPASFKTTPFQHQADELLLSAEVKERAIFWEQGTGKSKYGCDTTAHNFRLKRIEGAVVVAPGGVERNWITDELPRHMADDVKYKGFAFRSSRSGTKWHKNAVKDLLLTPRYELPILSLSYDAWLTDEGKQAVWDMFQSRPTILHVDESAHCKNEKANRTKSVIKAARYAAMSRIYSGTPVDNSPFDLYSQIEIVAPGFWMRELGLPSFFDFKNFFGIWIKNQRRASAQEITQGKEGKEYSTLVMYQNIAILREVIKKISSRVLKDDVLDLPPKLYTKRYYEMSPAQQKVYDALENEFMAEMPDDPEAMIYAELPIVRMTRLQQVLCGYVPAEGDEEPRQLIDPKHNPRADATTEFVVEAGNQQTGVIAHYRMDIDILMDRLRAEGRKPVRYDGKIDEDERERSKRAYLAGDASDIVLNPAVGAEGLTFVNAHTVAVHNNNYRMGKRKQYEDRWHRIGQVHPVLYGDMVCSGTRDERAIEVLIKKHKVSEQVLGDVPKEWL